MRRIVGRRSMSIIFESRYESVPSSIGHGYAPCRARDWLSPRAGSAVCTSPPVCRQGRSRAGPDPEAVRTRPDATTAVVHPLGDPADFLMPGLAAARRPGIRRFRPAPPLIARAKWLFHQLQQVVQLDDSFQRGYSARTFSITPRYCSSCKACNFRRLEERIAHSDIGGRRGRNHPAGDGDQPRRQFLPVFGMGRSAASRHDLIGPPKRRLTVGYRQDREAMFVERSSFSGGRCSTARACSIKRWRSFAWPTFAPEPSRSIAKLRHRPHHWLRITEGRMGGEDDAEQLLLDRRRKASNGFRPPFFEFAVTPAKRRTT